MEEKWKNIEESSNYEVSSLGNFRNKNGRILKLNTNAKGYLICNISVKGRVSKVKIHRLVAKAFLPEKNETVNHKNGIKTDNNVSNLEWLSTIDNKRHYHKYLKIRKNQYC